jgi:hypothetical protein
VPLQKDHKLAGCGARRSRNVRCRGLPWAVGNAAAADREQARRSKTVACLQHLCLREREKTRDCQHLCVARFPPRRLQLQRRCSPADALATPCHPACTHSYIHKARRMAALSVLALLVSATRYATANNGPPPSASATRRNALQRSIISQARGDGANGRSGARHGAARHARLMFCPRFAWGRPQALAASAEAGRDRSWCSSGTALCTGGSTTAESRYEHVTLTSGNGLVYTFGETDADPLLHRPRRERSIPSIQAPCMVGGPPSCNERITCALCTRQAGGKQARRQTYTALRR